jgi:poly(A) polymerase
VTSRSRRTGRGVPPDSRKPDVTFADAVEADLSRRDFTVNAMALLVPASGAGAAGDPR